MIKMINNIFRRFKKFQYKLILEKNYMNAGYNNLFDTSLQCIKDFQKIYNRKPKTIIDIGACVGIFSISMAKILPKSNVFSFEPVKESFEIFNLNKRNNNSTNVIAINKGIFSENKKMSMSLPNPNLLKENQLQDDGMPGLGRYSLIDSNEELKKKSDKDFASMWDGSVKKIDAEFITLEEFSSTYNIRQTDIIKIDCEGSEVIIIESNKEFIKNSKMLLIEHHPEFDKDNILSNLMIELGYKIFRESGIVKTWINLN